MKALKRILSFILSAIPLLAISQYTDIINSNRPGQSVSAYAIGKNVLQTEFGLSFDRQKHFLLSTESTFIGADVSLRYGLLLETLEINWEAIFLNENRDFITLGTDEKFSDLSRNRIGLKYLVYDPFKDPEKNKPNLYSWKANHGFKLKNLIPAVSVYAGANLVLGNNPFYIGEPTISSRVMVVTQSRIIASAVLITNIAYDRIGTDFTEMSYVISLSYGLKNPKWSIFIENQGIESDRYSDLIVRSGSAYLCNKNFQINAHFGVNFKNTPSRIFGMIGASYRIDMHIDKLISIENKEAEKNGGAIKKSAIKKQSKKLKKKK